MSTRRGSSLEHRAARLRAGGIRGRARRSRRALGKTLNTTTPLAARYPNTALAISLDWTKPASERRRSASRSALWRHRCAGQ